MIDHDRLFKELVTTFFTEFVELLLPELAGYLDASSIEFLDKEVFTDVTEGERHEVSKYSTEAVGLEKLLAAIESGGGGVDVADAHSA